MNNVNDTAAVNRLLAFGFQPGLTPRRNAEYATLVDRCRTDQAFAQLLHAAARGFDLTVIAVDPRAGLVLGATAETQFAASVTDHITRPADRPIAALAHLAIAALAYYRPEDLDDPAHVGRVTVRHVDAMVERATKELERQVAEAGADDGVPADHPDLIQLWRYYQRRNPVSSTGDDRAHSKSRHALIKRVAEYLADNGMLRRAGKENGGTYTTTARYQIQVRELAGQQMLGQLAELGITAGPDGTPAFSSPQTAAAPATPATAADPGD
ncbi:hypothetical protein EAO69_30280 [Streptomyces sp. me109]|uniref:hypothetical protein n=1 Tax=Streptomyces sp. me109 TaxID=1827853 RepID=UPI0011CD8DCE|nr:hypothetical protein [Streptomyces sp. me109]TXS66108.1 hypothetical protein EAO69_30280 [Streptomyces sp. me109]